MQEASSSSGLSIVAEIEALLTCKVCRRVYESPIQIFNCGHNSCAKCVDYVSKKCPICRCRVLQKGTGRNLFIANLLPNLMKVKQYLSASQSTDFPDDEETYISQEEKVNREQDGGIEGALAFYKEECPVCADTEIRIDDCQNLHESPTEYEEGHSEETRFTPDEEDTYIQSFDATPSKIAVAGSASLQASSFPRDRTEQGDTQRRPLSLLSQSMASWGKEIMRDEIDDIENLIREEKSRNEQIANAQNRGSASRFLKSTCWKSEEQSPKRAKEDSQGSILNLNVDNKLRQSSDALCIDNEFYSTRGNCANLQTSYIGSMASWGNEIIDDEVKQIELVIGRNPSLQSVADVVPIDFNFSSQLAPSPSTSPTKLSSIPVYIELGKLADDDYVRIQQCLDKNWFALTPTEGVQQLRVRICSDFDRRCRPTLGYMKALSLGFWIVSIQWVRDSIQESRLLQVEEFELEGAVDDHASGAPCRARTIPRLSDGRSTLFDDFEFYYVMLSKDTSLVYIIDTCQARTSVKRASSSEKTFSLEHCELLVHICGGKFVSQRESRLAHIIFEFSGAIRNVLKTCLWNRLQYREVSLGVKVLGVLLPDDYLPVSPNVNASRKTVVCTKSIFKDIVDLNWILKCILNQKVTYS